VLFNFAVIFIVIAAWDSSHPTRGRDVGFMPAFLSLFVLVTYLRRPSTNTQNIRSGGD
jgi:hypothetical protein